MTAASVFVRCQDVPLPSVRSLAWDQAAGRACVACGKQLTSGAISRGLVRSRHGVHVLDTEVWCCPDPEVP